MCSSSFSMRSKRPSPHEVRNNEKSLYRTLDRWLTSAKTINNGVCTLGRSHDEQNINKMARKYRSTGMPHEPLHE
jgi:hypothetical protein